MLIKIKELEISDQEMILDELANGESSKMIALKFKLSPRTIESKIDTMKTKYSALNTANLLGIYFKDKIKTYARFYNTN